jgi:hypothetical protein
MISPAVGRVLWFWQDPAEIDKGGQPMPAFVCFVHNDRLVNLAGFTHCGHAWSVLEVPLVQEEDPIPENGSFAQWMPYQIGQAKK